MGSVKEKSISNPRIRGNEILFVYSGTILVSRKDIQEYVSNIMNVVISKSSFNFFKRYINNVVFTKKLSTVNGIWSNKKQ